MITCYNLSVEYIQGQRVLKDISLKISKGAFYFLTGASGAGKSTLLSVLSLSMRPTSGRLSFGKQDVTTLPRELLPDMRRKIGVVRQDFSLLNHLTVEENIALPLKIIGESNEEIKSKTTEMLEWIGLSDCSNSKPSTLSGGQQQRVAIARAVINNPMFLIADEPSGNLDSRLSNKLMYLFEELNKMGTTIIFATHDESLVKKFKHHVLHIENGRVIE